MTFKVLVPTSMSLEMLAHSACWHGRPSRVWWQGVWTGVNSDSKKHICTSMVPVEVSAEEPPWEPGNHRKVGPRAHTAWSTVWEAAVTVWRSQVGRNCWEAVGLSGLSPGCLCLGVQLHPTLGLPKTDAADMTLYSNTSPYSGTGQLLSF